MTKASLEDKSREVVEFQSKLAEARRLEQEATLQTMQEKHKVDDLEMKIKNQQAELQHLKEENEYFLQSATEASVKIANIYEDYEKNQMILMKKNRVLQSSYKSLQAILEVIDAAMVKEKIRSQQISDALSNYKHLLSS